MRLIVHVFNDCSGQIKLRNAFTHHAFYEIVYATTRIIALDKYWNKSQRFLERSCNLLLNRNDLSRIGRLIG